jgi:PhnB protein
MDVDNGTIRSTEKTMSTTQNSPILEPYLFFNGRCEEALEFYRRALGAEIGMVMRFKDNPDGACAPGTENKVMHASFKVGGSNVMASDGRCSGQMAFVGFALSLLLSSEAEAARLFAALAEGGQVQMPLAKTFFSPSFGMVADKFGVGWMILVRQEGQG